MAHEYDPEFGKVVDAINSDEAAVKAVEADAALREKLSETFNARAKALGWVRKGKLLEEYREPAFEFLMGAHAALVASGHPGFNGMELMVASVRGADFVFPITA